MFDVLGNEDGHRLSSLPPDMYYLLTGHELFLERRECLDDGLQVGLSSSRLVQVFSQSTKNGHFDR